MIQGFWSSLAGGGAAGVSSLNGQSGALAVPYLDLNATPSASKLAWFDGTSVLGSLDAYSIGATYEDLSVSKELQVNNNGGGLTFNSQTLTFKPLQASVNEQWNINFSNILIDQDDDGFAMGTSGQFLTLYNLGFTHTGTADIGGLNYVQTNTVLGDGVNPISVNGVGVLFGFGSVNANVTIDGPLQGYGMQYNVNAAATVSSYASIFYDFCNIGCPIDGYISFSASPTIAEITNNNNYTAFNSNVTIPLFDGNAGFNGLALTGTLGTFDTGGYNGLYINHNVTSTTSANGVYVNMQNVTAFPGVQASLTEQDLFYEYNTVGTDGNALSVEYTPGGTAGSEAVSNIGPAITVQIDSGVSTATQIKAALDAYPTFTAAATVTITGVGGNPQVTFGPTNLAGGINAGNKWAGYFDGDVNITGSLSFGGSISVGVLNAFGVLNPIIDGGGNPTTIHSLVSQQVALNGVTTANADTIGVNTAALITLEANSITTSGAFGLGPCAMALPAVVETHTGSTLDYLNGGTFALSLSGTSTGGTVNQSSCGRFVAIPNGITTINRHYGVWTHLPFGGVATAEWGLYIEDSQNYLEGALKIGGSDTVANSSVALEIESTTKAPLMPRMTSAEIAALTAINGMGPVYNTDTDKFQGYAGGAWVDFH